MANYFYSKKTNGFYPISLKETYEASPGGWPDDAVAVSDEIYHELYAGQAKGKVIAADNTGNPVLMEPPEPEARELIATAEQLRNTLMAEASIIMAPLLDAVDLDEATEEEKNKLVTWKKYRVLLNRVDISKAPAR